MRSHWAMPRAIAVGLGARERIGHATTGSPELAEVLGWEPPEREVFFGIQPTGEPDLHPDTVRIGPANGWPRHRVRVSDPQRRERRVVEWTPHP